MKNKYRILKILMTVMILGFLLSFSLKRFNNKPLEAVSVNMNKTVQPVYFIDEKDIRNIVKNANTNNRIGDIDIPALEKKLNLLPAVDSANVYLNLNGNLSLDIKQRVPVFRLNNDGRDFYVDAKGVEFPISKNYSHPCMLVTGDIQKNEYKKLGELVKKIDKDDFSKKYFIGISKNNDSYNLLTSEGNYKVEIGDLDNIELKVKGFKAFVEKYLISQDPEKYSKISVKYDNQIVTTLNPNYKENDSIIAVGNKEIEKAPVILKKKALAEAQNLITPAAKKEPSVKKETPKKVVSKPKANVVVKKSAEKPKVIAKTKEKTSVKSTKKPAATAPKSSAVKSKAKVKIE